jgi:two-component system sensor kinase FixL
MAIKLSDPVSKGDRVMIVACAIVGVVALQICERYVGSTLPLGGFFLLPLFVLAAFVSRWTIFAFAIAMALSREFFGPSEWDEQAPFRLALSLVAFTGGGLFAGELIRNRRMTFELTGRARRETARRLQAEQEARAVVESSPAAVLTVDSSGKIAMANEATRKLLGSTTSSPEGDSVADYIPFLATLLDSEQTVRRMRTTVEARGKRRSGEEFYVQAWISLYDSASGPRLAAILLDVTEQLRDREEAGLRQLLSNSRIIAGAVSHELRNLAAAAKVLHHNMGGYPGVNESADYEPLGSVIDSVLKLSSEDLSDTTEQALEGVDVAPLLEELRTIIAPKFAETGVGLEWEIAKDLPQVRVDHSGLLQVFLNLAQNSRGVLEDRFNGRLRITAYALPESVLIRFSDNGPGVSSAERLFQPFQPGASSTGLGLFVSRAIIRTFGGELHHTQRPGDCCFIVELPPLASIGNGRG